MRKNSYEKKAIMACKTLELLIPDTPPYDEVETWFETFVGTHIGPIVPLLKRFWFSRYGGIGSKKWIKFRFEYDDLSLIQPDVDKLMQIFCLYDQGYQDWDYAGDIGEGQGSRFLGDNGRHQDKRRRGEIAFDFVHSSARLFLDGLRGPDINGRFQREPETASGFNHETTLEQYLHLFCNITGAPSFVVEATHPQHGNMILSDITFGMAHEKDAKWTPIRGSRVKF